MMNKRQREELERAFESIGFKVSRRKQKSFDKDEDGDDTLERHQATESWQGNYV